MSGTDPEENENENKVKKYTSDKFVAHRGEFVPVTPDLLKGKKITMYAEFVEDEDDAKEKADKTKLNDNKKEDE